MLNTWELILFSFQHSCDISCSEQKDYYCRRHLKSILNSYDDNGDTPLISAAIKGHLELCRQLVSSGADVNLPNQLSYQTPLLVAIESNRLDVVKFLIENFADVQLTDNVGITPLYSALRLKSELIVSDLISSGCDVNIGSQDHTPLFYAARLGSLPIVKVRSSFFLSLLPFISTALIWWRNQSLFILKYENSVLYQYYCFCSWLHLKACSLYALRKLYVS